MSSPPMLNSRSESLPWPWAAKTWAMTSERIGRVEEARRAARSGRHPVHGRPDHRLVAGAWTPRPPATMRGSRYGSP
ncbi:hypothetical protein [Arthrobacter sp.]|uniref:hypothetical protein n=1 Tax=Arthrobacter sp. TaxID=1667 RepID=UPI003A94BB7D